MKTLKTLLIVGALVFATSAANAQSSYGLTKFDVGTHHLEAKFVDDGKTVSQDGNQNNRFRNQNAESSNQNSDNHGVNDDFAVKEGFEYDWTSFIITMLF